MVNKKLSDLLLALISNCKILSGAPVSSQIMSGTTISQAKNSGILPAQVSGESFCAFFKPR
jgi:hypothetical protein